MGGRSHASPARTIFLQSRLTVIFPSPCITERSRKLMSGKSENTSRRLDRPFDPDILRRAKAIARQYQVVMWFEDGEYYGKGVELPGVMADGKTPGRCMSTTREALVGAVAHMIER